MTVNEPAPGVHGKTVADNSGADAGTDRAFFGHPRGLGYLAGTELWERFSFYSMQSLLMLYMTKYLLLPENSGKVTGLGTYRSVVEGIFGPMTDLALSAQTFGLYSGFMLVTPLIGAWLGDRVLGRTKTVTIGALLMSAGHLTMAIESAFLLAMLLLILGGGCFIANLQAQIGGLYSPIDSRRTRAFGIYLMALNIGSLTAPLIAGTLGEKVGWHWGFGAAGIGMIVGLAIYLIGRPHLPADTLARRTTRASLTRGQWVVVGAILLTLIPKILSNAAAQQAYGIMLVWADTAVDRKVGAFEIPVTWINTADGIMTIVGILFANRLWAWQERSGREPNDLTKIAIGNVVVACAFVLVGLLAKLTLVPLAAWLLFYFVLGMSFVWWDSPAKALIARYAPKSVNGTMFAMSSLAAALGFFLLGSLGRFYEPLGPSNYFLLTAALPIAGAVMLILFGRLLQRLLASEEIAHANAGKTSPD